MDIPVGISACVIGEKVRFDGSHKRARFITEELAQLFDFKAVCPEVGSGMAVPRPIIRQVNKKESIRILDSKNSTIDVTPALQRYSERTIPKLADLCGYIVCAKSPTCGMERVKVYNETGTGCTKTGIGLFTGHLMKALPWLPVEEDGRLCDPLLRENFITRVYALNDYYHSMQGELSAGKFIAYHSRYKLLLMACSPKHYNLMGKLLANLQEQPLKPLFVEYRQLLMTALKNISNKKLHSNTLMHIQGYFKKQLNSNERQAFARLINEYRIGEVPLLSPLTLIKHYLQKYPDNYLKKQVYLNPHPPQLKLRYGL
jgi:uncharacterized protein YbgA (DUF1722 family)/uncharacterized protein YbbK (DUF523 family)